MRNSILLSILVCMLCGAETQPPYNDKTKAALESLFADLGDGIKLMGLSMRKDDYELIIQGETRKMLVYGQGMDGSYATNPTEEDVPKQGSLIMAICVTADTTLSQLSIHRSLSLSGIGNGYDAPYSKRYHCGYHDLATGFNVLVRIAYRDAEGLQRADRIFDLLKERRGRMMAPLAETPP